MDDVEEKFKKLINERLMMLDIGAAHEREEERKRLIKSLPSQHFSYEDGRRYINSVAVYEELKLKVKFAYENYINSNTIRIPKEMINRDVMNSIISTNNIVDDESNFHLAKKIRTDEG